MGEKEIIRYKGDPRAERDRERKRMDRLVTVRALLIEAGAAGLLIYFLWLVLNVSNQKTL